MHRSHHILLQELLFSAKDLLLRTLPPDLNIPVISFQMNLCHISSYHKIKSSYSISSYHILPPDICESIVYCHNSAYFPACLYNFLYFCNYYLHFIAILSQEAVIYTKINNKYHFLTLKFIPCLCRHIKYPIHKKRDHGASRSANPYLCLHDLPYILYNLLLLSCVRFRTCTFCYFFRSCTFCRCLRLVLSRCFFCFLLFGIRCI